MDNIGEFMEENRGLWGKHTGIIVVPLGIRYPLNSSSRIT